MSSKFSLSKAGIYRRLILREPLLDCVPLCSTAVHCRGFCSNILELSTQFRERNQPSTPRDWDCYHKSMKLLYAELDIAVYRNHLTQHYKQWMAEAFSPATREWILYRTFCMQNMCPTTDLRMVLIGTGSCPYIIRPHFHWAQYWQVVALQDIRQGLSTTIWKCCQDLRMGPSECKAGTLSQIGNNGLK